MIFTDNVKLIIEGNLEKMLEIIKDFIGLLSLSWGVLAIIVIYVAIRTIPAIIKAMKNGD